MKPSFSCGFPMVFPWFSHGSQWIPMALIPRGPRLQKSLHGLDGMLFTRRCGANAPLAAVGLGAPWAAYPSISNISYDISRVDVTI